MHFSAMHLLMISPIHQLVTLENRSLHPHLTYPLSRKWKNDGQDPIHYSNLFNYMIIQIINQFIHSLFFLGPFSSIHYIC